MEEGDEVFFGGEPKFGQPHPHESGGFVWPAELGYGLFEHRGGYLAGIGVGDEDEGCEFSVGVVQAYSPPPVGHRVGGGGAGEPHHVDHDGFPGGFGESALARVVGAEAFSPPGGEGDGVLQHKVDVTPGDVDAGFVHQAGGAFVYPAVEVLLGDCAGFYRHVPPGDCVAVCRFDGDFRCGEEPGYRGDHWNVLGCGGGQSGPWVPHRPYRLELFRVDFGGAVGCAFGDDAGSSGRPDWADDRVGFCGEVV